MRPIDRTSVVWIALLGCLGGVAAVAGEGADWDARTAAHYLDARASEWQAFRGADRGQGADKVSCLSCHTSMSYSIGRPALRRVAGEDHPAAQESRILEQVRRRVAHWGELDSPRFQLSYDFDDRKKVESWGTEAILNAMVLATDDRRRGLQAPSDATRQALRHLWATQQKDGSWDWLDFGLRPWEADEARYYGTALAAIAVGTAPGYPVGEKEAQAGVDRLRRYLGSRLEGQNLHNQLFALWASLTMVDVLKDGQNREIVDRVRSKQQEDGGWSLSALVDCHRQDGTPQGTAPDGYATGLAVLVLRRSGMSIESPQIARGLGWLRTHQQPAGNWVGVSLNKRRDPKTHVGKFMSDAATAFAVLALEDR